MLKPWNYITHLVHIGYATHDQFEFEERVQRAIQETWDAAWSFLNFVDEFTGLNNSN